MSGSAYRESYGGLYITIKTMSSFVLCSFNRNHRVSLMSLSIISTAELLLLFNNRATPPDFLFLSFRFFVNIKTRNHYGIHLIKFSFCEKNYVVPHDKVIKVRKSQFAF